MRELRFRRRCGAHGALAGVALPALLALLALPAIHGGAALAAGGIAAPPPAAAARTAAGAAGAPGSRPALVIGVTLHPYYSWTRNIVGDLPGFEVRPILPGEIDAGDYQPRPDDIKKLAQPDSSPHRVSHRPIAPLPARHARL